MMTPQKASILLRAWHKAFKDFGKSNETNVKELLEAADLIDSLAADLDTLRKFTVELSARNEELHKEKLTLALRVKQLEAERNDLRNGLMNATGCRECKHFNNDAGQVSDLCMRCRNYSNWEWRGVQKEE